MFRESLRIGAAPALSAAPSHEDDRERLKKVTSGRPRLVHRTVLLRRLYKLFRFVLFVSWHSVNYFQFFSSLSGERTQRGVIFHHQHAMFLWLCLGDGGFNTKFLYVPCYMRDTAWTYKNAKLSVCSSSKRTRSVVTELNNSVSQPSTLRRGKSLKRRERYLIVYILLATQTRLRPLFLISIL